MCGITGIWNRNGEPVPPRTIERFTRSLAHRGPDGEGTMIDDGAALALGHRRLSILDPSAAGHQPMQSVDRRYWTTFNGELYNFVELRTELEGAGYRFATQTDTELIAAAYDRWGEDCQFRFNGMWAFALWDARERRLFLSRDRFGVKPLYFFRDERRFAFASELKAFLALDGFAVREYTPALARALDDPMAAEAFDATPLAGVSRLLPGRCMLVTPDALHVRRWWNTLDHLAAPAKTLAAQAAEFRDLLFDAARIRLRSDVPVGIALSGGLDSSSVLCSLAGLEESPEIDTRERYAPEWKRAFTATFAGTPLDELRYAKIVAQSAHVPLYEVPVEAAGTAEGIERVVWDLEELWFTDTTPIWSLYRALRGGNVTVALNGDGADELFGGYMHHTDRALRAAGGFLRSPRRFTDLIETRYHLPGSNGPIGRTGRLRLAVQHDPALRALSTPARALYAQLRQGLKPGAHGDGYTPRHSLIRDYEASDVPLRAEAEALRAGLSPLGAYLYGEFHATKLPAILRMFDRASMAHGVEIRNAFLDWRIVCYAFSLPDESKIGGGFSKRIVREAMRGIVPEAVRTRRDKIGFNAPLPQWFAGPLRPWLWDVVNEPSFLGSDLWDGPAVRDFVARKRNGVPWTWVDGEAIWPFLNAHLWRTHFLGGIPPASGASGRVPT
jgi:asparagine synthase (glutamine-hydrolysing)